MPLVSERGSTEKGRILDISKALTMVDDSDVQVLKQIPKGSMPGNVRQEWSVDDEAEDKPEGVSDEKDEDEFEDAFEKYDMLEMYIMQFRRGVKVGLFAQMVAENSGIPRGKAMAKSVAKYIKRLAKDIEMRILGEAECQKGKGNIPYEWRGLFKWAQTTAQAVLPVPANYRPAAGAIITDAWADIDEEVFGNALQARFERKGAGKDLVGVLGTQLKRKVSSWTTYDQTAADVTMMRRYNEDPKVIRQQVDVLMTDFGTIKLQMSNFINVQVNGKANRTSDAARRRGIIMDMADLQLSHTEKEKFHKLEDGGGGPRGFVRAINLLKVVDPTGLMAVKPA